MLADIAVADRAEQRVRQRVQHHVGVGMAFELVRVRNFHPAEPDMIAVAEAVNVKACARRAARSRS